jgi:hypothetical protein
MWAGTGGGVTRLNAARLHQFHALQTGMPVLADDDVIMHGDAERLCDLDNRFRHLDVGLRRRRVAGGMVGQQTTLRAIALIPGDFYCRSRGEGTAIGIGKKGLFVMIPQHAARPR